jgi:hypothetical protein
LARALIFDAFDCDTPSTYLAACPAGGSDSELTSNALCWSGLAFSHHRPLVLWAGVCRSNSTVKLLIRRVASRLITAQNLHTTSSCGDNHLIACFLTKTQPSLVCSKQVVVCLQRLANATPSCLVSRPGSSKELVKLHSKPLSKPYRRCERRYGIDLMRHDHSDMCLSGLTSQYNVHAQLLGDGVSSWKCPQRCHSSMDRVYRAFVDLQKLLYQPILPLYSSSGSPPFVRQRAVTYAEGKCCVSGVVVAS